MTADVTLADGPLLAGASVQRLEIARDVAILRLRAPDVTWWVLMSSKVGAPGVGLLKDGGDVRARVRNLIAAGGPWARGATAGLLRLDAAGVWLRRGDETTRIAVRAGTELKEEACDAEAMLVRPSAKESEREEWARRGEDLLERLEAASVDSAKRALLARVAREDARLARRVRAVLADLDVGRAAESAAEIARLFVPLAARAPRGTKALSVVDWATGEPVTRELTLDPAETPKAQVDAIFSRARRLARGRVVATTRLEEAHRKQARLAVLARAVTAATTLEEVAKASDRARAEDPALLPRASVRSSPSRRSSARSPYRAFVTTSGARVLVGRGAADNDALTLHVARPHDLWLHAKGVAGAHVVVPLTKGHDAPAELLVDAAHLAAHFSDAREDAVVDITYTPRRYLRKRRGAPPGQVQLDREKVLVLRVDTARLSALLAREEA